MENKNVDVKDVEAVVDSSGAQTIFNLTEAIAKRDIDKAMFILHNLLEKGESAVGILFMLIRHLTILWKIRGFFNSGSSNAQTIQRELRIYPKHYAAYAAQTRSWSSQQLQNAMSQLYECDQALKSGLRSPEIALDRLVFRLVQTK